MPSIYLIRHGKPDFPGGARMCLGRTDLPLGALGRLQAAMLGFELRDKVEAVYSSPLSRAVQTAAPLGSGSEVLDGLTEQYAGEWDGLTFDEIRARWPELYARRGIEKYLPMPGAEPDECALSRFSAAVATVLAASGGSAAVVAHAGVIRLYLNSLGAGMIKLPYGSYVRLELEGGRLAVSGEIGVLPHPELTDGRCIALLEAARLPENTVRHCAAVAEKATELADRLGLDAALARRAALLHDIARPEPKHPETGAGWLRELGYPEIADIVRLHHDHTGDTLDEAAVVFIADKLVQGDRAVTLDERFAASAQKCKTPEQLAHHQARRLASEKIVKLIEERGVEI